MATPITRRDSHLCFVVISAQLELLGEAGFRYKSGMGSDGSTKQVRMLFSGRVQGVGFRYTACRIAEPFKLTGCVRNLADGDVEVIAEGKEQDLIDFLNAIRTSPLGHRIVRERLEWAASTGKYENFGVSF